MDMTISLSNVVYFWMAIWEPQNHRRTDFHGGTPCVFVPSVVLWLNKKFHCSNLKLIIGAGNKKTGLSFLLTQRCDKNRERAFRENFGHKI